MKKTIRFALIAICLPIALLGLPGCASNNVRIGPVMESLRTADDALQRFGRPSKIRKLEDGGAELTWRSRRHRELTPEEKRLVDFGPPLGSNRAMYNIPYVPMGGEIPPCEIKISVDALGEITGKSQRGNFCDSMIRNPN